ncbi:MULTISPECIES: DUF1616 domain-containing protein [Haloferax]|uniref:DUF1616 domain-containing protein n=1 Tax=Haloferax marinum TaxID=2666143 RepID=A0A6A8G9A4_9EURY|nr:MULTISPECIES: DUF1616 domain-containing protein [Haloferax]KAB1198225.1 DUF1616 domain-containing protein [Haloferax sp. CBA1150]MRW97315.1 DUF1616 domain-containing protein [Haloferax marinum]
MTGDPDWRLLLPRQLRELPADLAAAVVFVGLVNLAVFLPVVDETPLRVVLGLPFVLFVPGYAMIAALFPEAGDGDEGIDGIERVALSFGVSIAVVPLIGLVLNFTPWGIRLVPIMVATSGVTLALVAVGARRRNELPASEQFEVPYEMWLSSARDELFEPETRTDAMLNVVLVVSVVLATASVGYAVAVPKEGESFTELYLLTEGDDGELVADGYPEEFVAGESKSVIVGVGNQEYEQVNYTVVSKLQRVRVENNSTTVLEERELARFSPQVEHNETWRTSHEITPTMTGERLRLVYLLYKGEPAANPTVDSAYREVHLWVNVSQTAQNTSQIDGRSVIESLA